MAEIRHIARLQPLEVHSGQLFGIEVEFESVHRDPTEDPAEELLWAVEHDGSLRNEGMEFVTPISPRPWTFEEALKGIEQLWALRRYRGYTTSARTGIHIHTDFSQCTYAQVRSTLALYCLLEPFIFQWLGENREQCIYCIPWYSAPSEVDDIAEALFAEDTSNINWMGNLNKYTALYVQPLHRFGTIEWRQAPTFRVESRMVDWLTLVDAIVTAGKDNTAERWIRSYYRHGIEYIINQVGVAALLSGIENADDFLDSTMALDLAEAFSSWSPETPDKDEPWESYELTDAGPCPSRNVGAMTGNSVLRRPAERPRFRFYDEYEDEMEEDY